MNEVHHRGSSSSLTLQDPLALGHSEIDLQHREMHKLMISIQRAIEAGSSCEDAASRFTHLLDLCELHYEFEEKLMERHGYPGLEEHRKEHHGLLREGAALLEQLRHSSQSSAKDLFDWWRGWSLIHVVNADHRLGRFLAESRP